MNDIPVIVDELLAVLAERFGTTGVHLWGVMVRQAYVEFYIATGALIITGLAFAWSLKWILREREDEGAFGAVLISGVCAGFATLFFLTTLPGALNPEYFALQKVFEFFPGGK
jgi:dolichyl-phosphate-mannose--protein O-mannosyl transferase